MALADRVEQARGSFERRVWGDAFTELSAAHRERQLDVEDLERLAVAAYMVGRDDACEEAWIAAHHAWLRRGDAEGAARCAFGQALGLFFRGDLAPAMGWVSRGRRLLEESRRDCGFSREMQRSIRSSSRRGRSPSASQMPTRRCSRGSAAGTC
jgi:hypothetical protein